MTMRYFIPALIIFLASCSNHKNTATNQHSSINTVKLFDPKPEADSLAENVFHNCLMLETDSIAVILNEQKYKLPDIKELDKFLNANSAGITKEKFYIIYDITITTKKIIDIINIVKAAKIDNYKAVKLEGLFNLNEPK